MESLEYRRRSWCSGYVAGLGVVDIRNAGRDLDAAPGMLACMLRIIEIPCIEGRMSGLPPLERQWAILRTMTARHYRATLRELANEHGVSQKTIRRDVETLRCEGFRLTEREEAHVRKCWFAEADPAAPPLSFDVSELLALWVSRSLLHTLAGTESEIECASESYQVVTPYGIRG